MKRSKPPYLLRLLSKLLASFGLNTKLGRKISMIVFVSVLLPLLILGEYLFYEYYQLQVSSKEDAASYRMYYVASQRMFSMATNIRTALLTYKSSEYLRLTPITEEFLRSTPASFMVEVDLNGKVIFGLGRTLQDTHSRRYVGQKKPGMNTDGLLGTKETEVKVSYPEILPEPFDEAHWMETKRMTRGCELNWPILRPNQNSTGYELVNNKDLICLGIADQAVSPSRNSLILISAIPSQNGGHFIGGILLDNASVVSDYFSNYYAISYTSFFAEDRVVLTNVVDSNNLRLLNRKAETDVYNYVLNQKDSYSRGNLHLWNSKLREWYIPLFRDSDRSLAKYPVGILAIGGGDSLATNLDKIHVLFLVIGQSIAVVYFIARTPFTKRLLKYELETENAYKKIKVILETVNQGILALDEEGVIQLSNNQAHKITEYEDLSGKPVGLLFKNPFTEILLRDLFLGNFSSSREEIMRKRSRSEFPCELTTSWLGVDPKFTYLLVFEDITDRKEAEEERRELALIKERVNIGNDMHTTLAQYFGMIVSHLKTAMDQEEPEEGYANFAVALKFAKLGRKESYESVEILKPEAKQYSSFAQTLKQSVSRLLTDTHMEFNFAIRGEERKIDAYAGKQLLRLAQEAVNNARKHSGAQQLSIMIEFSPSRVQVIVKDNGRGFDVKNSLDFAGNGITEMRERAMDIDAEFEIQSNLNEGTLVKILYIEDIFFRR